MAEFRDISDANKAKAKTAMATLLRIPDGAPKHQRMGVMGEVNKFDRRVLVYFIDRMAHSDSELAPAEDAEGAAAQISQ